MAKPVLILKAECTNKNERKNGGTIIFAVDITDSEKGQLAREAFTYQSAELKKIQSFSTGKIYTITITE